MSKLLIKSIAPDECIPTFRMGGRPLVSATEHFNWPICPDCQRLMRFYGQIPLETAPHLMALIFLCDIEGDGGLCSFWDPEEGNNHIQFVNITKPLILAIPPSKNILLDTQYGATDVTPPKPAYLDIFQTYSDAYNNKIVGQLGGEPSWYQGEENITCHKCCKPMTILAHLEEVSEFSAYGKTETETELESDVDLSMNFCGGGIGYLFVCTCDENNPSGKFLIQR